GTRLQWRKGSGSAYNKGRRYAFWKKISDRQYSGYESETHTISTRTGITTFDSQTFESHLGHSMDATTDFEFGRVTQELEASFSNQRTTTRRSREIRESRAYVTESKIEVLGTRFRDTKWVYAERIELSRLDGSTVFSVESIPAGPNGSPKTIVSNAHPASK
ncbi:MAG: hypothetical protein AAF570_27620, partial [Bacteroidota bacterium]